MTITPTSADAGTIVRALRRHARLSQRELAERAGIPKSTLAAIEAGRRPARWTTMARLFAATGVQLSIATDTGTGLAEPHDALDRYGRTRLPAHVDPRPADDHMALHNQFRDDVLGVRRTHTFYHPKPHSRWQRRRARRR